MKDKGSEKEGHYDSSDRNENEMMLVEKWRDADAIAIHNEQAHFKRLVGLKDEFVNETIIEKYTD